MVCKKGDWLPFAKMVSVASFRVGKLQLPSLQRAAWIPLRQAKKLPPLNDVAAAIFAKGSQSPLLHVWLWSQKTLATAIKVRGCWWGWRGMAWGLR